MASGKGATASQSDKSPRAARALWLFLWGAGSRRLHLGGDGGPGAEELVVEDATRLLAVAAERPIEARLGVLVESGLLELWLDAVAREPRLAVAAREVREDDRGLKGERWLLRAGARRYRIAGHPVDNIKDLTKLPLRRGSLGPLWEHIRQRALQERFAGNRKVIETLERARSDSTVPGESRALAACLELGLRQLPVELPSGQVLLARPADALVLAGQPGGRAALDRLLTDGVMEKWADLVAPGSAPGLTAALKAMPAVPDAPPASSSSLPAPTRAPSPPSARSKPSTSAGGSESPTSPTDAKPRTAPARSKPSTPETGSKSSSSAIASNPSEVLESSQVSIAAISSEPLTNPDTSISAAGSKPFKPLKGSPSASPSGSKPSTANPGSQPRAVPASPTPTFASPTSTSSSSVSSLASPAAAPSVFVSGDAARGDAQLAASTGSALVASATAAPALGATLLVWTALLALLAPALWALIGAVAQHPPAPRALLGAAVLGASVGAGYGMALGLRARHPALAEVTRLLLLGMGVILFLVLDG